MGVALNKAPFQRFPIRFNRWTCLLFPLGGHGPAVTYVELSGETVSVRAGWVFHAEIPQTSVVRVSRCENPWWNIGGTQTDLRGSWAVSGSYRQIVALDLDSRTRGRVFSLVPISLRRVLLSLDDPDGFLAEVASAPGQGEAGSPTRAS